MLRCKCVHIRKNLYLIVQAAAGWAPQFVSTSGPHRFFQMWQQIGMGHNTDLFVWVADTAWRVRIRSP
jgi:hypothetical protein